MRCFFFCFTGQFPCRIICGGDAPRLERDYLRNVFAALPSARLIVRRNTVVALDKLRAPRCVWT
ncbi:hypothetical protein SAMN05446635_1011 [Burkholderia sp. OK233]|nr:hypothetical protein SAMN05446635_1011 [Burkholderia sp. OK233]